MTPISIAAGLLLGIIIGIISGLIGIGGTLLLPIGVFAFSTYYKAGHVDVRLALLIAAGFAIGGWAGGSWAQHLSPLVLRRVFATLLIALAAKLLATK